MGAWSPPSGARWSVPSAPPAFLAGASRTVDFEATGVWINGSWGSRIDIGGTLDTVVSITVEDGRITRVFAIRNPHKLAHLDGVAALTRS